MTEENRTYITQLKVTDVPWHRLTTAYGRGTDFPAHLAVLERMEDMEAVKESLYELTTNMEHQGTLWHTTPFGMVFLFRILEKALAESGQNPVAHFLAGELLDFFACILQCFHDGDEMEHAEALPLFSDLLKEEYLWSEEYEMCIRDRPISVRFSMRCSLPAPERLSVIRNWRPKKRKQHWNRSCWNGSPIWISISAFVSGASTGILAGCPRQGSVKTMILTAGIPLTM